MTSSSLFCNFVQFKLFLLSHPTHRRILIMALSEQELSAVTTTTMTTPPPTPPPQTSSSSTCFTFQAGGEEGYNTKEFNKTRNKFRFSISFSSGAVSIHRRRRRRFLAAGLDFSVGPGYRLFLRLGRLSFRGRRGRLGGLRSRRSPRT